MVRGAIAFALCLQIESDNKETIKIIAMTIALITTIIGSSTLKPFADYIGIGSDNEERDENSVYNKMVDENINRS